MPHKFSTLVTGLWNVGNKCYYLRNKLKIPKTWRWALHTCPPMMWPVRKVQGGFELLHAAQIRTFLAVLVVQATLRWTQEVVLTLIHFHTRYSSVESRSGAASPKIGGGKMYDFWRMTLFKAQNDYIFQKFGPSAPPLATSVESRGGNNFRTWNTSQLTAS